MDLIVEGRGSFIGKHQGRLRVTRESKVVTEAPIIHLESVLIVDNGSRSPAMQSESARKRGFRSTSLAGPDMSTQGCMRQD
jgi:hypothetical protein